MQIPSFIQDRLPQFWLLLGVLFLATGMYLGLEYPLTYLYFAVGVVCIFWGFCIVVLRPRKPEYSWTEPESTADQRPDTDQSPAVDQSSDADQGPGADQSPGADEEEPLKQSMAKPVMEPMVELADLPGLSDLPDAPEEDS